MKAPDFQRIAVPVREAFQSKPFQIFIIFAIVVAIIYYAGRSAGLKKAEESVVKLPDNGSGIPKGFDPTPYANELFEVMKGLGQLTGAKDKAFRKTLELPTNDMVAAVNNKFNQLYLSRGSGTLVKWLEDEMWYDYFTGIKDKLITRLKSIGAK
jgi:hypothetical protein